MRCSDRQTRGKRWYRCKKASLEARIQEHREEIAREWRRPTLDLGLIQHWKREMEAFQAGIQSAQKRLAVCIPERHRIVLMA
jgi:hypothetical protein